MTKGDDVKDVKDVKDSKDSNEVSDNENTDMERIAEAKCKIKNYVYISMGVGLIPVPYLDALALVGVQLKMLSSISNTFDIKFSRSMVKSFLASLVGSVTTVVASGTLASYAKAIPVVGTTIGILTMPIIGGATTYAVGKVFLQHFASGGTFLDFDPATVKDFFAEKFKEGKKVATGFSSSSAK
ncbi:MAG: YcjF family protein [Candidatus Anammoxibacter sp.]